MPQNPRTKMKNARRRIRLKEREQDAIAAAVEYENSLCKICKRSQTGLLWNLYCDPCGNAKDNYNCYGGNGLDGMEEDCRLFYP